MSSNPLDNFSATSRLGDCQFPLDLTLIQANSGVFSCHTMLTCRKYSYFLKLCSHCILKAGGPGRLFSHQPGDSRLISFLGGSEVIFHSVSLDLFADISVLTHARARSKPTYTVSVLLATDIISGAICLNIIDDSKAVSVIQGLKLLALKYRMPQRLIVDAGSQLVSLNTTNKDLLEALANHQVQVTPLLAGHQFGNTIERLVQILK